MIAQTGTVPELSECTRMVLHTKGQDQTCLKLPQLALRLAWRPAKKVRLHSSRGCLRQPGHNGVSR